MSRPFLLEAAAGLLAGSVVGVSLWIAADVTHAFPERPGLPQCDQTNIAQTMHSLDMLNAERQDAEYREANGRGDPSQLLTPSADFRATSDLLIRVMSPCASPARQEASMH